MDGFPGYVTPWDICLMFVCLPSPLVMAVYIPSFVLCFSREHICTYV